MDNLKEEWINNKKRRWFVSKTSLIPKQYHVGDKNGPDFSFGKDLISLFSTRVQVNPQKGR
jgi:hypothetical protein